MELLLGLTVTDLLYTQGRPSGVRAIDRQRGEREISARVVVGADGRDSDLARIAGVRARVMAHERFCYFAYYRNLPLVSGERLLLWFLDPDVAYAFPQDEGITVMAMFLTNDRISWFTRDVEADFERYFDGLPSAPDLAGAERISKVMGKLELPNKVRRAARDGLAFIGDAAMAADPLWGVGCGFALQSAEWLSQELGPGLAGSGADAELDASLKRYASRHRHKLIGHFLLTSDYSTARRFNGLERLLFSAAAKDPLTAESVHAVASRSIGPTDPQFVGMIARAAWVNVARRRASADTAPLTGPHAGGTPLPAGVERVRLDVGGLEVPISCVGPRESPEAVVFLHGNPGSSRDWDDLLARTGPFARGVALDMPGFGQAEKPDGFEYTIEGYARFLGRAFERLGIERAHLVLHDFGGPWGLEWAARNPDRLASAVLIDTGALLDYDWHYLARIWRTPGLGEIFQAGTTRSGLRLALRHGNPRELPRAFVDRMYDDSDRGTRRAVLRLYRSSSDPAAVGRRHADALRPHDRPALVIWGAHDPYLPVSLAERQREMFPSAAISILANSGHWPIADDPDGVARIVEPFLRDQLSTERRAVLAHECRSGEDRG